MGDADSECDVRTAEPYALDCQTHHGDWQYAALHAAQQQHRWATLRGLRTFIRHDDVVDLFKDGRHLREAGPDWLRASGITEGPLWDWWQHIMFANDGEKHRRLRTLVSKAFAAHNVDHLRVVVAGIVEQLGDELQEKGTFEATDDYAYWVPARTICHFLGIPETDVPIFARWSADLGKVFSIAITPETRRQLDDAIVELSEYVRGLITLRRRQPQRDLITALIEARDQGDRLSEVELVALIANIILGGHDTTKSAIACTILNLVRNPEQWALLRREPSLVEAAVEESLRKDPPVVWLLRVVTEPFTLRGLSFEPGETIVPCLFAANHDEAKFPDSTRFDIARVADGSMSFGLGPHFCIGAWIARMQVQESVRMFVNRFSELQAVDEDVQWTSLFEFRAPQRLRLRVRH